METKNSTKEMLFNNIYKLKRKISSGSFGVVFIAKNTKQQNKNNYIDSIKEGDNEEENKFPEEVAIKLEELSFAEEQVRSVQREAIFLKTLHNITGVPKMIWSGTEHSYDVLILELLGKDLASLLKTTENKE